VGESIFTTVESFITDGTFAGGAVWDADMENGYIGVAYGDDSMPQQVSDALKAEVEALKAQIIAGEIVVDSTRD